MNNDACIIFPIVVATVGKYALLAAKRLPWNDVRSADNLGKTGACILKFLRLDDLNVERQLEGLR